MAPATGASVEGVCGGPKNLDSPRGGKAMSEPEVIGRIDRDGGYIETLMPRRGEVYYRSCVGGICRYSSDFFQAEIYLNQLLAR